VDTYVKKGGDVEDTVGRKCLCNALMANVGHAMPRDDGPERAILTSGSDFASVARSSTARTSYSAADVLEFLLAPTPAMV
jgi:nitronate monooxygenase